MGYIRRHLEDRVLRLSQSFPVILITGPRQAGKTTMLRMLTKKENSPRAYVTLDDLVARDLAKNDPALFLQLHKPPVLIDEVQYAPELFPYIKIYADEHHEPGAFWLTGSQIFRLMRGVRESLAGRVALLHMSPLSQREILGASCVPFSADLDCLRAAQENMPPIAAPALFTRLWQGSMPVLAGDASIDRDVFYASYLSTYVERDVRELSGDIDALRFHRFVTAVAARTSQLLNYKSLADDAEIDQRTAKDWLNILETLGIVFLLHPYSNNILKRTIKTPKVYFYDTGLVCHLTRWSSPATAESGAMSGALLENYAVSELVKGYQNAGREPYLYFYRDRDAREIDIVIEENGTLFPLEIKKTASPDKRLARTFAVLGKPPLRIGTGAILCMAERLGALDKNCLIVPIGLI